MIYSILLFAGLLFSGLVASAVSGSRIPPVAKPVARRNEEELPSRVAPAPRSKREKLLRIGSFQTLLELLRNDVEAAIRLVELEERNTSGASLRESVDRAMRFVLRDRHAG